MLRKILIYGLLAGVLVGGFLFANTVLGRGGGHGSGSVVVGYASMLIALSAVFIAVKRHRDQDRGGVIPFWPAFAMGLGVSVVAGALYVLAWEAALAVTGMDFAAEYTRALVAQKEAEGASAEAIAKFKAEMAAFAQQYASPAYRLPMTFMEIFPVGVLVSLFSAALLRNPRFLPARA